MIRTIAPGADGDVLVVEQDASNRLNDALQRLSGSRSDGGGGGKGGGKGKNK